MPSVRELSALYENVLLAPRRGPDVCPMCFNFTAGYKLCYGCAYGGQVLDAVLPISYSVALEQLHHALASYKRLEGDVIVGAVRAADPDTDARRRGLACIVHHDAGEGELSRRSPSVRLDPGRALQANAGRAVRNPGDGREDEDGEGEPQGPSRTGA